MTALSSAGWQGLGRNWWAGRTVCSTMSRSEWPESTMRMAPGLAVWASRRNMAPSMPGMRMSATTTSKGCSAIMASPDGPSVAKAISHSPRMSWNMRRRAESTLGSSSTKRMRVFTAFLR